VRTLSPRRKKEILAEVFEAGDDLIGVPLQHCTQPERARRAPGRDSPRSIVFADTLGANPVLGEGRQSRYKMINARAETIAEKPAFREPFQSRPLFDSRRWILRMVEI